jgi:hypothetical protein
MITRVKVDLQAEVETLQKEEFRQWKEHPVTKQLFGYLWGKREELKEVWATGGLSAPTIEELAIRNASAVGAVSVLEEILSVDDTTFNESNQV